MAFKLFRKNNDAEDPREETREQDSFDPAGQNLTPAPGGISRSPEASSEHGQHSATDHEPEETAPSSRGARALDERGERDQQRELPDTDGYPELVALMDKFRVSTLQLDQHGNEMTAVLDPSEKPERKTVVDTESSWFDAVAKLYTASQNSARGPWRRAQVVVSQAHQGRRAVDVDFTYPDSEEQSHESYVQTLASGDPTVAGTDDGYEYVDAGDAQRGHGQPADAHEAPAQGTAEHDVRGEDHRRHEDSSRTGAATAGVVAGAAGAGAAGAAVAGTREDRTESGTSAAHRKNVETQETGARASEVPAENDVERERALAGVAQDAERRKDEDVEGDALRSGDATGHETAQDERTRVLGTPAPEAEPTHRTTAGTAHTGAEGSERVGTAATDAPAQDVAGQGPAGQNATGQHAAGQHAAGQSVPAADASAQDSSGVSAGTAAGLGAAGVGLGAAGAAAAGSSSSRSRGLADPEEASKPSNSGIGQDLPERVEDEGPEFGDDGPVHAAAPGAEPGTTTSSIPITAPTSAAQTDVAPSFRGTTDQEDRNRPSSNRLASGNLVLTEADVVSRLSAAQRALFGHGGTALDSSSVLIRVRALGTYFDALTHVRRNGFWDQRKTFELLQEEDLPVLELKKDSYVEGNGSPIAMMIRFTPGVPPKVAFDYADEERFVKYEDRLPAQQYIEELRMYPRTGANIPEHMNDALTEWTL